jgi:glycosyltransferase involved in cell wall biosynthesis
VSIRVLRIIDRLNVGGPARHVVLLTSGLASGDFDTRLITGVCATGEDDMSFLARKTGVNPVVIPHMSREVSLADLLVIVRLVRECFRWKPEIIHTHKSKAGALGRIAAFVYKWLTPSALWFQPRRCWTVHTYHGHIFHHYYGHWKTRVFVAIERALARICTDIIVTISPRQKQEICKYFHVGREHQHRIVPLGGAMEQAGDGDSFRRELKVNRDCLLVGSFGRLTAIKNPTMFVECAARFVSEMPPSEGCRFVLIGDGELRLELQSRAKILRIEDNIVFTGCRHDALRLYLAFDIVALTSLNEGTPLTLIEAMACARPIIATEVGGVADLMGRQQSNFGVFTIWENGLTVPSGDLGAFTRALQFLAGSAKLRQEMGERGRAFVIAHHSDKSLLENISNLYLELRDAKPVFAPKRKFRERSKSQQRQQCEF